MKKIIFIFLLFGFIIPKVHSQNAALASGGESTGSGGKVSFSVGQIAYTNANGSNGSVNQGVQQPVEISTLGKDEFPAITIGMSVFPNPTPNNITLKILDMPNENLSYQIIDLSGKLILNDKISTPETFIKIENLNASTYLLSVVNNNRTIKTFKIIKN